MAAWEFDMGRYGDLLLDLLLNCCICLTVVFMLNELSTFWKKLGLCDLRLQTLRQLGSQVKHCAELLGIASSWGCASFPTVVALKTNWFLMTCVDFFGATKLIALTHRLLPWRCHVGPPLTRQWLHQKMTPLSLQREWWWLHHCMTPLKRHGW